MNASLAIANDLTPAEVPASMVLTPMQMAYQLAARGADAAAIREMLDVGREIERDAARRAFDAAFSAAKAEIPPIIKNRTVDFTSAKGRTNYRHEDLGEIARVVNPILAKHGLSYRFRTEEIEGGRVKVTCRIAHAGGHAEENALSGAKDDSGNKNNLQQAGSTITYLQRYTLKAALGLAASNDDDGKGADDKLASVLSEAQRTELLDLIDKTETDVAKFCETFKVNAVADLTGRDFEHAVKSLQIKLARKMSEAPAK